VHVPRTLAARLLAAWTAAVLLWCSVQVFWLAATWPGRVAGLGIAVVITGSMAAAMSAAFRRAVAGLAAAPRRDGRTAARPAWQLILILTVVWLAQTVVVFGSPVLLFHHFPPASTLAREGSIWLGGVAGPQVAFLPLVAQRQRSGGSPAGNARSARDTVPEGR
jgi:hypothetical protein